jgi:hypothetical protein
MSLYIEWKEQVSEKKVPEVRKQKQKQKTDVGRLDRIRVLYLERKRNILLCISSISRDEVVCGQE